MKKALLHTIGMVLLTLLTQVGGIAWAVSLRFRRRLWVFAATYAALSLSMIWIAPIFGRVPLPCSSDEKMGVHSAFYCVLNRHYVVPELRDVLADLSQSVDNAYPGTKTVVLDANFPLITGFPLLPHLSHNDGRKADIAFYYQDDGTYLRGKTRSPLGYFAYEDGPTDCPKRFISLRWDMAWVQRLWPSYQLDIYRTVFALNYLGKDPRIGKLFLEPHLKATLSPSNQKVRFQGCRAARHDDHIHLELK
ncbi:MAG: hypothetical protein AAF252_01620 [Pseudomonadota bacterium]